MKTIDPSQDPVADVRAARDRIAKRFDYDVDRLFDYYQKCEREHKVKRELKPQGRKSKK